jgi:hypothetical protein
MAGKEGEGEMLKKEKKKKKKTQNTQLRRKTSVYMGVCIITHV